jgi:hypothetical protein
VYHIAQRHLGTGGFGFMTAVSLLAAGAIALALPASGTAWGGRYSTGDTYGTSVDIQVSDTYPVDQSVPQSWATFLGSLVHGPELAQLRLVLQPAVAVENACGPATLTCYDAATSTLESTPEAESGDGPTARGIVIHEYAHHIASTRSNAPWNAENTGTKRWASYENVCLKTREGTFSKAYAHNPGEGFAEAYRVLNLKLEGASSIDWGGVDDAFYPDATALKLLREDILDPWRGPTTRHVQGSFGRGAARTIVEKTALDGTFTVHLRASPSLSLRLALYAGAKRVAHGIRSLTYVICGQRQLTLEVERLHGHGSFSADVSKP